MENKPSQMDNNHYIIILAASQEDKIWPIKIFDKQYLIFEYMAY